MWTVGLVALPLVSLVGSLLHGQDGVASPASPRLALAEAEARQSMQGGSGGDKTGSHPRDGRRGHLLRAKEPPILLAEDEVTFSWLPLLRRM